MWSTLKISSGAQPLHDKRDISALDTVLFHSNLSSSRRKCIRDVPTDKIVLSSGPKISKTPLKRRYWWLQNKERKCHFQFVERRFLAAINCTGSAEGVLVPSFSASHIGPRADYPFHRPAALFRPAWCFRLKSARFRGKLLETLRYDNGDGNGDVKGLNRVFRLPSAFPPKVYLTKKS